MDYIRYRGRIRFHLIAGEAPDEMVRDWLRMSESERERLACDVAEFHNILTTAGRTAILNYIANNSPPAFAQQFSVGTGPIVSVSAGDTSVATELARTGVSGSTIIGTQVDITFSFAAGSANGTYTNVGIYGGGASGTLGTGTLYTHALANFTKTSSASLQVDYLINIQ